MNTKRIFIVIQVEKDWEYRRDHHHEQWVHGDVPGFVSSVHEDVIGANRAHRDLCASALEEKLNIEQVEEESRRFFNHDAPCPAIIITKEAHD